MKLIIVRGLPGSGKSTFTAKMFPGLFHVENDMFHVRDGEYRFDAKSQKTAVSWCMEMCDAALGHGMDVVVSNTFTKRKYVAAYARLADRHGASLEVYKMNGEFENVHSVPNDVKKNMANGWEDWDDETYIYPNMHFDKNDPACRLYMATKFKVGDHVIARRWAGGKDAIRRWADGGDAISFGEKIEYEDAEAVVTRICQASYDYLNVFYEFIDDGGGGLSMTGDLRKA